MGRIVYLNSRPETNLPDGSQVQDDEKIDIKTYLLWGVWDFEV